MKIIITENKLFDNFQKLIDRELSKLRARYRSEEISASNWYLTIFSKIVLGRSKSTNISAGL